jgi:hypothetical protein
LARHPVHRSFNDGGRGFPISAFSIQPLAFPQNYHVWMGKHVLIFNNIQTFFRRDDFCRTKGMEPRMAGMARMEKASFLIRAWQCVRASAAFPLAPDVLTRNLDTSLAILPANANESKNFVSHPFSHV